MRNEDTKNNFSCLRRIKGVIPRTCKAFAEKFHFKTDDFVVFGNCFFLSFPDPRSFNFFDIVEREFEGSNLVTPWFVIRKKGEAPTDTLLLL